MTLQSDLDELDVAVRTFGRALWGEVQPKVAWVCEVISEALYWSSNKRQ